MPKPLILSLVESFTASILAQEVQAFDTMIDAWLPVEAAIQTSIDDLLAEIEARDNTPTPAQIMRMERLQALLLQVQTEVDTFAQTIASPVATARQQALVEQGLEHADQLISAANVEGRLDLTWDRLPVSAVQNLVGVSGDGSPLVDTLRNTYAYAADGILKELLSGVATGKNPRVTARKMVRNGLSQSLSHMLTVARTESLRAYRTSSNMGFRESGVVDGWIRIETFDNRVCAGCLARHGRRHSLEVDFAAHPNCRGTLVPDVKGFDLEVETGEQWLRSQPKERQIEILGAARVDYLDQGGDFSRLAVERSNDTWGAAVVPRPLKDLLKGKPPKPKAKPKKRKTKPVATVTEPVREGTRPTVGPLVSAALEDRPKKGKYAPKYQRALDAINKVHSDGDLPSIPIKTNNSKSAFGTYSLGWNGDSYGIKISGKYGDHHELTLAHEIGHFLDHKGIVAGSQDLATRIHPNDDVYKFLRASDKSKAVIKLKDMVENPSKYETKKVRKLISGKEWVSTTKVNVKYAKYMSSREEVWARAYAQYIATKSQDPTLLEQLRRDQGGFYPKQWDDDDFIPISEAIDELFKSKGWIE